MLGLQLTETISFSQVIIQFNTNLESVNDFDDNLVLE